MEQNKKGKLKKLSILMAAVFASLSIGACRAVDPLPDLPDLDELVSIPASSETVTSEESSSEAASSELSSEEPSSALEFPSQESRAVSTIKAAVSKANTAAQSAAPPPSSSEPSSQPSSKESSAPREIILNADGDPMVSENDGQMRAVWISYLEFQKFAGASEYGFYDKVRSMYDECVRLGLNTVIVQVRPHGDAIYPSGFFPWSDSVSRKMGLPMEYDPLSILVSEAHSRGLKIHAWVNPYRTMTDAEMEETGEGYPVQSWYFSADRDLYMIMSQGRWWLRPGNAEVQELIVNGIKELVRGYDLDGIHFDDYFYNEKPENYGDDKESARENTTALVRECYRAIKEIDKTVLFGISPVGGFLQDSELPSSDQGYLSTNLELWCRASGYIDYVMPQIYWEYDHPTQPFSMTVRKWKQFVTEPDVKLYIGLAPYKSEIGNSQIEQQVADIEADSGLDGYCLFRYDFIHSLNL